MSHSRPSSSPVRIGWSRRGIALPAATLLLAAGAHSWTASGTVKDLSGGALSGVVVTVKDSSAIPGATTGATGQFTLSTPTGVQGAAARAGFAVDREGRDLVFSGAGEGLLDVSLTGLDGGLRWQADAPLVAGRARVEVPRSARVEAGVLLVRKDREVVSRMVILQGFEGWRPAPQAVAARASAVHPTLLFRKAGYRDTSFAMTSESMSGIAVAMRDTAGVPVSDFVEDHRAACTVPAMPAVGALTTNAALPDPFTMMDGTKVTTRAQWTCRREEIAAMLEKWVYGEKPRNPAKVTGSFSGDVLTVSVTDKGKTVSFTVKITKPSSGSAPYAAVIGYGGGNIGGFSSLPVAKIEYTPFTLASEGSGRGKGVFYDLYGSNHPASELMAQAWGVSRILDALMVTPAAGIDPRRVAVTGCSRYGKGAIVAGAFDQRLKLTIPQESGSGGVSAWRIVATLSDAQPLSSTASEAYWTRADFAGNFANAPGKLPVDNHQMDALVAPNGLLVLDNSIAWLGPKAGYGATIAAKEVFAALGASEAVTYSSVGGHTHCSQPTAQDHWVASYMKKYLLGQTGEAAKIEAPADYTFDRAKWINWSTPTLK